MMYIHVPCLHYFVFPSYIFCIRSPLSRITKIMLGQNYLLLLKTLFSCLVVICLLLRTCVAKKTHHCPPSSCGNITNISYPFRLRNDPKNCGNPDYELACENNTTLYLDESHKYIVRAINYANYTIHLTDPSILEIDTCSLPNYSISVDKFRDNYPYSISRNISTGKIFESVTRQDITNFLTFMSCPDPVNNSLLLEVDCGHNQSHRKHTYINFGELKGSYIMDSCTIDLIVMTSLSLNMNASLSEIHSSPLYGFELSWFNVFCGANCRDCRQIDGERAQCGIIGDILEVTFQILGLLTVIGTYYLALRIISMPFMLWFLIYKLRRRHLSTFNIIESFLQSNNNLMPIRYSYKDIKKMTRGFKEKLGQGGYGSVYKGKLRSGHIVAVKLLNKPKENGQDFINEIATIGRIHHVNVVKLVGFCVGRFNNKCALVYDFMPNGSLEKHIFTQHSPNPLTWERKYDIAVGVAHGIEYLHRGCDIQILHFDIKPHNILLDDNFTPKISDFGLAKLYSTENNTITLTAARGTIGYVAPELINRSLGGVSYKADVYSFGMLLIEMVGLNRDITANDGESSKYFPEWIYDRFNKGKDIETGDAGIEDADNDDDDSERHAKRITRKMTIVGLWCIQMSPADRPSMSEVVKMLESDENVNLQIPPRASEQTQTVNYSSDQTWETESSGSMALLGDYTSSDLGNGGTSCIEMS